METLSDKNPAANVPARDIGAIKLNTVAARLGSSPLLVTTETMWKIRAVLIRECEDPARRRSQKLFVRIASAKEKWTSCNSLSDVEVPSLLGPDDRQSGFSPKDSGLRRAKKAMGVTDQMITPKTPQAVRQPQ